MTGKATGKESWQQVAGELEALGAKLKAHLERAAPEEERKEVSDALHEVGERLQKSLSGLGSAVRDPEVRGDVAHIAASLRDAFDATFSEVGARLRRHGDGGMGGGGGGTPS